MTLERIWLVLLTAGLLVIGMRQSNFEDVTLRIGEAVTHFTEEQTKLNDANRANWEALAGKARCDGCMTEYRHDWR